MHRKALLWHFLLKLYEGLPEGGKAPHTVKRPSWGKMVRCLRNGKTLPKGEKRHHRYHGYLAFLVELPQQYEARKVKNQNQVKKAKRKTRKRFTPFTLKPRKATTLADTLIGYPSTMEETAKIKLVLIGSGGVGKSAISVRFVQVCIRTPIVVCRMHHPHHPHHPSPTLDRTVWWTTTPRS